ncbi:MAG: HRDC domain-containing protein [Desulfamplus sp.]|nr:HRDC domain-containing protein [Desulfamplus sp.]
MGRGDQWIEKCIKAIALGLSRPKEKMPSYPKKKAPEGHPAIPERVNALKSLRDSLSQKTGIEPGFLMSNATISAIASARPSCKEELLRINGTRLWQVELIGNDVIAVLQMSA